MVLVMDHDEWPDGEGGLIVLDGGCPWWWCSMDDSTNGGGHADRFGQLANQEGLVGANNTTYGG